MVDEGTSTCMKKKNMYTWLAIGPTRDKCQLSLSLSLFFFIDNFPLLPNYISYHTNTFNISHPMTNIGAQRKINSTESTLTSNSLTGSKVSAETATAANESTPTKRARRRIMWRERIFKKGLCCPPCNDLRPPNFVINHNGPE